MPERKGTRQPHWCNASSLRLRLITVATNPPRRVPQLAAAITKLPYNPHLDLGWRSNVKTSELMSCPPTERPCSNLTIVSNTILNGPTAAYPGRQPMQKVGNAMRKIDIVSALRLPYLSPMYPIIIPPRGRIKKAPPNTAKLSTIAAWPSWPGGKKTSLRMSLKLHGFDLSCYWSDRFLN